MENPSIDVETIQAVCDKAEEIRRKEKQERIKMFLYFGAIFLIMVAANGMKYHSDSLREKGDIENADALLKDAHRLGYGGLLLNILSILFL